jgi:hypothetical protein
MAQAITTNDIDRIDLNILAALFSRAPISKVQMSALTLDNSASS